MGTTDDLRAIRNRIGVDDALRDTLDVLIAANDTAKPADNSGGYWVIGAAGSAINGHQAGDKVTVIPMGAADDGAGKGSTAAITGARSDAQPAEAPGEGRSEIGPQKGVQSLAGDLRDEASELCALANGKPYVVGVRPQDLIGIAQELDDYATRADALTAERDRLAADIAIMRDADLTATDVQRRRAEKAEAVAARVRALLDRPLIPSALLRDALDGVDAGGEGK